MAHIKLKIMHYYDTSTQLGKRLIREGLTSHSSKIPLKEILGYNKMADYLYKHLHSFGFSVYHFRAMKNKDILKYKNMLDEFGADITAAYATPYYDRTMDQLDLIISFEKCSSDFM